MAGVYGGAVSAPGREPVDGPQRAQQLLAGRDAREEGHSLRGLESLALSVFYLTENFQLCVFPFIYKERGGK